MLKVIVFLYQYYLAIDKSENLAYLRVMAWFFVIIGIFLVPSVLDIFGFKYLIIDGLKKSGRINGYIEGFLVSIPFFALFYILYPPNKLKVYSGKFVYPKNYIWYLRIGFIIYIVVLMGLVNYRIKTVTNATEYCHRIGTEVKEVLFNQVKGFGGFSSGAENYLQIGKITGIDGMFLHQEIS